MTPERLAHLKAHILNPPSASLNREWMLELVVELETFIEGSPSFIDPATRALLNAGLADTQANRIELFEMARAATAAGIGVPPVVIDDRPTPPEAPKAKKGKR